jgi:hypothetical protein
VKAGGAPKTLTRRHLTISRGAWNRIHPYVIRLEIDATGRTSPSPVTTSSPPTPRKKPMSEDSRVDIGQTSRRPGCACCSWSRIRGGQACAVPWRMPMPKAHGAPASIFVAAILPLSASSRTSQPSPRATNFARMIFGRPCKPSPGKAQRAWGCGRRPPRSARRLARVPSHGRHCLAHGGLLLRLRAIPTA